MDEHEQKWTQRAEAVCKALLTGAQASAVPGEQAARLDVLQAQANRSAAGSYMTVEDARNAWRR